MFLGDDEEGAEEEDEEELQQLSALDGLSSSPGKTGPRGVNTDSLSPGEDADTAGEAGMWECWPQSVYRGLDLLQPSLIIAVSGKTVVVTEMLQERGLSQGKSWEEDKSFRG